MAAAETTPLETLIGAIERFVQVPTLEPTAPELGDFLVRLRHGIDLLELGFATGAATFATTDEYDAQGSVTPIDWIRHHCRMSAHAAARSVAAGEQMGRLPATVAALDAGEIGFAHFSLLAGVAGAVSATRTSGALDAGVSGDASGDANPTPAICRALPGSTSSLSWDWLASIRSAASASTAPTPAIHMTRRPSSRSMSAPPSATAASSCLRGWLPGHPRVLRPRRRSDAEDRRPPSGQADRRRRRPPTPPPAR